MLRKRPGSRDAEGSQQQDVTPLDSDEQAQLVAALGKEARRQTTAFSWAFSAFLLVCALIIARCSFQLWFLEETEPLAHRVVVGKVPSAAFQASYVGYLLHLYLCHKIGQGYNWHIAPGVCTSWTFLFTWLAIFRRFEVTNFLFYWLPMGPSVLFGVAVYIFTSAKSFEQQIDELNRMRYNHKEL